MIKEIENSKSLSSILIAQFGQIFSIAFGLLICLPFVDRKVNLIGQICSIPVILILIFAKYNKPLLNIKIDYSNQLFIFSNALIGRYCRITFIPFNQIVIRKRYKWLLNFHHEVLEIKEDKTIKMVVPIIYDKNLVNQIITEIEKLQDLKILNGDQFIRS